MTRDPLVCPSCEEPHPSEERFCRRCGMPLVYDGSLGIEMAVTDRQARARKIKPQYAEGDLIKAAWARNQTEAEFIQSLLLEEGVPSVARRSPGFDVPDMLAAGPRDVLVPRSGYDVAREMLLDADITKAPTGRGGLPARTVLLGVLGLMAFTALVVFAGSLLVDDSLPSIGDRSIVVDEGLAGVALGMSDDAVRAKLGDPDGRQPETFGRKAIEAERWVYARRNLTLILADGKVVLAESDDPRLKTDDEVGVGSDQRAIVKDLDLECLPVGERVLCATEAGFVGEHQTVFIIERLKVVGVRVVTVT